MGEYEKINLVKAMLGNNAEVTDETISAFLKMAASAIMDRANPFRSNDESGECPNSAPQKYAMLQCRLAVRYISRMGGEGEDSHNENGINRSYASVNDEDLLSEVMQIIAVR